jgi:hypothetical protein
VIEKPPCGFIIFHREGQRFCHFHGEDSVLLTLGIFTIYIFFCSLAFVALRGGVYLMLHAY